MVEDYVMKCELCQKRKERPQYRVPMGEVKDPSEPCQVSD